MPLAYRWDLRLGSSDYSSVYKRIYTYQRKTSGIAETETTYEASPGGTVGWQVDIDDATYYRAIFVYIYREIFGFASGFVGPAGMDVSEYRSEMADILAGKPVEPAAADASTYSLALELNDTINVGTEIAILTSPATSDKSATLQWGITSSGDAVGSISAGAKILTKTLTAAQAAKLLHTCRAVIRPTSEAANATSRTYIDRDASSLVVERRNPAAKGIASEITPGALAVIVGNEDTELRYRYVQNYGGYAQAYISIIADNVNTGERVVIAKKAAKAVDDGLTATYTIPADTLAPGTWDITVSAAPAASANYYDNDSDFWTTGQTVRYTVKDNPTAGGVTCDGKPVPTVSWESTSQAAWQVRFGDYDSGARAGSETSFTIPKIYADGAYPVRVRTATAAGEWSAWTETYWAAIRNVPPEGVVSLTAETVGGNVRLTWTAQQVVTDPILTSESEPLMTSGGGAILAASMIDALSDNYAVFRDGKLIAVTSEEFYVDKLGGGEYQVIAMESLYYIPSNIVDLWPQIACDMISPDGGENWIALKYTPDVKNEPEEVRTEVTYYYYAGREKPIAVNTQQKSRSKNFSYRFKRRRDAQALRALNGCEVILKTSRGERIWGIVEDMTYTDAKIVTVSFSIRETDEEEDHVEYQV